LNNLMRAPSLPMLPRSSIRSLSYDRADALQQEQQQQQQEEEQLDRLTHRRATSAPMEPLSLYSPQNEVRSINLNQEERELPSLMMPSHEYFCQQFNTAPNNSSDTNEAPPSRISLDDIRASTPEPSPVHIDAVPNTTSSCEDSVSSSRKRLNWFGRKSRKDLLGSPRSTGSSKSASHKKQTTSQKQKNSQKSLSSSVPSPSNRKSLFSLHKHHQDHVQQPSKSCFKRTTLKNEATSDWSSNTNASPNAVDALPPVESIYIPYSEQISERSVRFAPHHSDEEPEDPIEVYAAAYLERLRFSDDGEMHALGGLELLVSE